MRSFFGSVGWLSLWLRILRTLVVEVVGLLCDGVVGFWLVGWKDVVVIFLVGKGEVDGEVIRKVCRACFALLDWTLGGRSGYASGRMSDRFVGKRVGGMCCCMVLGRRSG